MKNRSVRNNFAYNLFNTLSNFLFPLITFPYVSRILLPEGVGIVQFYDSIIGYVVLLTSLGIPVYGIREIARLRDDQHKTNVATLEILILHLCFIVIGYAAIAILAVSVAEIKENLPVFLVLSLSVFLTTIGCPWYFSGIEDFKYITIRAIVVRFICVILLFIFVKTKADIIYYAAYIVLASVGNNLINLYRLSGTLVRDKISLSELHPTRHVKPALKVFAFNLITSIYVKLDTVMLGFLSNNENVGLYASANKIVHMFLNLFFALGQVTMPRISNLIANGDTNAISGLANKSFRFVFLFSLPLCVGMIFLSTPLIRLLCGVEFLSATYTIKILSIIIIVIALSNLFGMQLLYPQGKINIVNISISVGACINLCLNYLLIPIYGANGAAFATVVAESSVLAVQIIVGRKYIPIKIDKGYGKYLPALACMTVWIFFSINFNLSDFFELMVSALGGVVIYFGILYFLKEEITKDLVDQLYGKYKGYRGK